MIQPDKREYKSVVDLVNHILKSDQKRIAICTWAFTGGGGVGRVVEQQARELSEAGYKIAIFALGSNLPPPTGVRLINIGGSRDINFTQAYRLLFPLNFLKLLKYAKKLGEFDLIFVHRYPLTMLALLAKLVYRVNYICWYHSNPDLNLSSFIQFFWLYLIKFLEVKDLSIKKADLVCSVSKSLAKKLKEDGVNSIVVPNKIDTKRFKEAFKEVDIYRLKSKYGIKNGDIVLLFVGRITPQKNIHNLIKVFNSVNQIIPNSKLIIVGKISDNKYFKRLKGQANNYIVFTGYINEELSGLYSIADLYVTCSLSESFNLPLKEAQAFGVPVIAFDIPVHQEVVENGFLVHKDDYNGMKERIIEVIKENKKDV